MAGPWLTTPVHAQATGVAGSSKEELTVRSYDIPPGPLAATLNRFAEESGIFLAGTAELAQGRTSPGLRGGYSPIAGLAALLQGTGLEALPGASGGFVLRRSAQSTAAEPSRAESTLPMVTVQAASEQSGGTPQPYAGGQVVRGGRLGLLGTTDVMDAPFSIASYSLQTIQDQQARSIADVVQNDPSVRMVSPQSNGSEVFSIRGFSVGNQDVSFDGLYGILPYWRGSVASAERIEILKGPSALLNGMAPGGSIGGAINVVPKRAPDTPLTQVTGTYLSDSNLGAQVDIGRRFGQDDSLGIRVNGMYREGDANRTSQNHGETAIALDYRGERARLFADVGYQHLQLDAVEGLLLLASGASVPTPPKADATYYQPWTSWKNDTTYGVLRGEFDLTPDWTAYAAVGQRHFRDDYLFSFGSGLTSQGSFTEGFAYASSWYNSTSADVGLRGRLQTGPVQHRLSLSTTSFQQDSGVLSGSVASMPSNIYNPVIIARPVLAPLTNVPKTGETNLSSFAAADTLSFSEDTVQLTLGLRQQQVRINSFSGTTGATTAAYDEHALTPALGLVVQPWRNVSLYGNYIEGLSQGPTAPTTAVNAGQIFAPFKSKQNEAGVKVDFGRIATTLSVFRITRPSGITDPGTNVFGVNGEQRNQGVEASVFGEVANGVRLLGGVMFLDATQTHTANGTYDGKAAVNSPKREMNIGGEWDLPFLAGLTLSARVLYTSSAYIDAANTQAIPSWSRLDVGARYAFKAGNTPVTLRANIENLFDRAYWMSSSLYRGNPRTLTLSATMSF